MLRLLQRSDFGAATGWIGIVLLFGWSVFGGSAAEAQLVPVKTVPLATGSQFQLYPSRARAMGNLSVAVNDPMGDAFVNPAKAARLDGTLVFSMPSYYTITGPDGSAQTLSAGGLVDRGRWFGGMALALQQLTPHSRLSRQVVPVDPGGGGGGISNSISNPSQSELSVQNQYVTVLGGMRVSDHLALAGKVDWAGLKAKEGVDLLYSGNDGLRQDGHQLDVQVGLLGEWGERSLSVLLLHNRVDMQHDVLNVTRGFGWGDHVQPQVRGERYFDRTNTWGLHLEYVRPPGEKGWRLGMVLSGNRKNHPKIPNYDLMNIPRDPGTSWASTVGLGVSKTAHHTTYGLDVLFEPILSETWANAQERIDQLNGGVLFPGEKTIVNDFTFANTTVRAGLHRAKEWWEFQLGVEVYSVHYWLTQDDRIEQTTRDQYEEWSEWRLTWGGGVEWGAVDLHYTGKLTIGTGRPGVASPGFQTGSNLTVSSFVVAPEGALTLEKSRVYTHQLSITVPLSDGDD